MSHRTTDPLNFVGLAVGAVRCFHPDLRNPSTIRTLIDLWHWRHQLTDADVDRVVTRLVCGEGGEQS